ncbi:ERF family protein [Streptomonospora litoralis]|uniref:ERF superfamily protein n=1 Tax=Streptomonospora litoralis TaxID=2498135 RepID=A0A4P6QBM0_9ACTN|nr:ERF family protein [Streptomonospora litoralis]QBI56877.1 ERF superfamily protein [Streptomonospora litoralis]
MTAHGDTAPPTETHAPTGKPSAMNETATDIETQETSAAPQPGDGVPHIWAALSAVMADIRPVGKGGWNPEQRFHFRSIEDVMNAANRALVTHGVIATPQVTNRLSETRETKSGSRINVTHLEVTYRFRAVSDGSVEEVVVWGEGADTADKSTNKAMSMALKYALMQALMIPTEDLEDGDADHPEASGTAPSVATDQAFLQSMAARVDQATTTSQLKELWDELGNAFDTRRISRPDADQMANRMKHRQNVIANRVRPEPAPDPDTLAPTPPLASEPAAAANAAQAATAPNPPDQEAAHPASADPDRAARIAANHA